MNKTRNVTEVKELSMEALAFISGGCDTFKDAVRIDECIEPGPPSGKNPESDYPDPVPNPFKDFPENLQYPGVFFVTAVG